MKIGLIGLGKMGYNLALNLKRNGHDVIGYDVNQAIMESINTDGVETASSLSDLVGKLGANRVIWMMIPSGEFVESALSDLKPLLIKGDIIVEGGNSNYKDSIRRSGEWEPLGVHYLDCGTSGGTEGALNGICAMIGGSKEGFERIESVIKDISQPGAYLHCGPAGSGHYVKMIHNGIEYGMMQAIAEGFEMLQKSDMDLDLAKIAGLWNQGSVVRSWLMELTERALTKEPDLASIKGIMNSSGEGKWTLETALEKQIATPVIALSLIMRYRSLEDDSFAGKIVAALRNEFGGHALVKK
ncbi:phosphogluconate dehydrogenase (NAD(+)-dependent, decarboxylating) [Daejeonella lutea]|uniref:6-phosphogluconate dehydrogenase n=1 Tax=Daejeonella lutea TaxID=572036 RepID=A0A1T5F7C9_9SPHI|nr:decarboxylating 6-phosphogluconate dehydrogenase [Daejeonella lutea]SKB92079.1 6-phosphogluconate dehydrogenase [Daejeonella lutea]